MTTEIFTKSVRTLLLLLLSLLILFSLQLALTRILQVDEAQNLYMAKIIASGDYERYFLNPSLFLLPLSWLFQITESTTDIYTIARLLFLAIFWLNIVLVAKCCFFSAKMSHKLIVIIICATLTPWWDYGIEIRHDNILLTGLLLIWWLKEGRNRLNSFLIGLIAASLFFLTVKSVAYTAPLLAYIAVLKLNYEREQKYSEIIIMAIGIVSGALSLGFVYYFSGLSKVYFSNLALITETATSTYGFSPSVAFDRLFQQSTLLVSVAAGATGFSLWRLSRKPSLLISRNTYISELILVLVACLALLVNPTPFPYNLINLTPFILIFVFAFFRDEIILPEIKNKPLIAIALAVLLTNHFLPFVTQTFRHAKKTNERQMQLIKLSELMTDAKKDHVYDASGLVLSRDSIHKIWYLHSLNYSLFYGNNGLSLKEMISETPPSVIVPNYRFNWLNQSDWDFIHQNYTPLSGDFFVLGKILSSEESQYNVIHAGRYYFQNLATGEEQAVTINGKKISGATFLDVGTHTFEIDSPGDTRLVWLGPQLDKPPILEWSAHSELFQNWY